MELASPLSIISKPCESEAALLANLKSSSLSLGETLLE
jgi:hypothetical protein